MQIKARFDDINPNTDFDILREAVNKFSKDISIILGVIPNCLDKFLSHENEYCDFLGFLMLFLHLFAIHT